MKYLLLSEGFNPLGAKKEDIIKYDYHVFSGGAQASVQELLAYREKGVVTPEAIERMATALAGDGARGPAREYIVNTLTTMEFHISS